MNSNTHTTASPLIQLFHNQLFDELESHRLKQLEKQEATSGTAETSDASETVPTVATQQHVLFPETLVL